MNAVAVEFDFVQPLRPVRRRVDEFGELRPDPLRHSGAGSKRQAGNGARWIVARQGGDAMPGEGRGVGLCRGCGRGVEPRTGSGGRRSPGPACHSLVSDRPRTYNSRNCAA